MKDELPKLVAVLKNDPAAWYKTSGITPPSWLSDADDLGENPETLRSRHETKIRTEQRANRWAHFVNIGLGTWLITQPLLINVQEPLLRWSEMVLGAMLMLFAALALSWRAQWARWVCAGIGVLVMGVPFLFSTANAAAYQLGYIPGVWNPFFAASSPLDPRNGTEDIITSWVSKAWPVSDAAVGGYTYLLEILTGIAGSRLRWRTMPWLVVLFGLMIAPLGITSIFFIIIQPVVIGTWSIIALIGAAAVLIQIPYSLDELIATPVRYLNMVLGAALIAAPFMFAAGMAATIASEVLGLGLIALSLRCGLIRERYGNWNRLII